MIKKIKKIPLNHFLTMPRSILRDLGKDILILSEFGIPLAKLTLLSKKEQKQFEEKS